MTDQDDETRIAALEARVEALERRMEQAERHWVNEPVPCIHPSLGYQLSPTIRVVRERMLKPTGTERPLITKSAPLTADEIRALEQKYGGGW